MASAARGTKAKLLALFEVRRGESLSGECLAQSLGVSRNAVWKAVSELRQEGYEIQAATNRGYAFSLENDLLSAAGIFAHLRHSNLSEHLFVYESLESTNFSAKEMALHGACHGTVVLSDCQTDGKAKCGQRFFSPPHCGLYLSFVLRREFMETTDFSLLTALAADAACQAVERLSGKRLVLTPPNELSLYGKKVGGILTEAIREWESAYFSWAVLGIGLNVYPPIGDLPPALNQGSGSICLSRSELLNRNALAAQIIQGVFERCESTL